MLRKFVQVALAMLALGLVSPASAETIEALFWEDKSSRAISEPDEIDTTDIVGRFRGVRVYALDGTSVEIAKVEINYADGSKHIEDRGSPTKLNTFNSRTRVIGPENGYGPEKFIDEVVVHYQATGEKQHARLRIVGVTTERAARAKRTPADVAVGPGARRPSEMVTPVASRDGSGASSVVVIPPPSGPDAAGGDVLFGVQSVSFGTDRDVIRVGTELGKFDKIRLRVFDNDIFMTELRVIYSNGEPDVLAVEANIPANARTKWFALKGDRFIKEIQLVYRSKPSFRGQARVEVYGEYAEGWFAPMPSNMRPGQISYAGEAFKHGPNRGWLYLGGQQPKFISVKKGLGYETDTVMVHRNRGFNRIRLDVKDRAITLNKLTIIYSDNSTDVVDVGKAIEAGSGYTVPTLKAKPIKEIQVSYRSRIFDRKATSSGYAFVEFWAQ